MTYASDRYDKSICIHLCTERLQVHQKLRLTWKFIQGRANFRQISRKSCVTIVGKIWATKKNGFMKNSIRISFCLDKLKNKSMVSSSMSSIHTMKHKRHFQERIFAIKWSISKLVIQNEKKASHRAFSNFKTKYNRWH